MKNGEKNRRLLKKIRKIQTLPENNKEIEIKERIKKDWAFANGEFLNYFSHQELTKAENKNKLNINSHMFFPKVRQSRTAFYQVEQALHYQLKQLFTREPSTKSKYLYDEDNIYEKISDAYAVIKKLARNWI